MLPAGILGRKLSWRIPGPEGPFPTLGFSVVTIGQPRGEGWAEVQAPSKVRSQLGRAVDMGLCRLSPTCLGPFRQALLSVPSVLMW